MAKDKKDKYADLSDEFKDAIAQGNPESIKQRVSSIAMQDVELRNAMKDDQDLADRKEQVAVASEPYREAFKMYKLQLEYCKKVLDDKGASATYVKAS
jgi:hypothetical protein